MNELIEPHQMGLADQFTIEQGVSGFELMKKAGRAVADEVGCQCAYNARIVVFCGPGNNGGDGLVAAQILRSRGFQPKVILVCEAASLKGDAAKAFAYLKLPLTSLEDALADIKGLGKNDVVVDALFGAGLSRAPSGDALRIIEAINCCRARVVAVDLPSGVDGKTGRIAGKAVIARSTVTFFRKKPGHVLYPGASVTGRQVVAQIGINSSCLEKVDIAGRLNDRGWLKKLINAPKVEDHKYSRGHLFVIAGDEFKTGAARLAARAGARLGVGAVSLLGGVASCRCMAQHETSTMVVPYENLEVFKDILGDPRRKSVVLGPGGGVGEQMREQVLAVLQSSHSAVLDADALSSFAEMPHILFDAIKLKKQQGKGCVVLTPHHGEFLRLFGDALQSSLEESKLFLTQKASAMSGATVIYKGPDTVIADSDLQQPLVNAGASPWLATAGSGDVLAGFVGGFLGSGAGAGQAAAAAVYLHSLCAKQAGPHLLAEDLINVLPQVLREFYLQEGESDEIGLFAT
ncbi:bifunctional ADP-dependent NAD(P)H-hydrate dehydratase/NAD(P)H-hydrate epimerase [Polycladidibacter stylochi]|uniref:bifunctional ADP-dependent NAD(P)H-hydrate dehydratase/NAD(P)H-hydrate epimerase n=1 Tax=Polycladidibacter stylochi TaxID=1807766 RepID=UPI0008372A0A|nr:bifunctional ADP-dependent NAD(P)H-hydrate dehydratase/NAD(P)H-hydrate epimerase [Pseudovibrio stylochi]